MLLINKVIKYHYRIVKPYREQHNYIHSVANVFNSMNNYYVRANWMARLIDSASFRYGERTNLI